MPTLATTLSVGFSLFFTAVSLAATPATQPVAPVRIVLVGDSTVTEKAGWGTGFKFYAGDGVTVVNEASGGRSSKSFRDEGKWDKAVAQKGDYMLIQFGHNDQPGKGPERETVANTTFKDNMVRYAKEAQAAGFKPILVTSLVRRKFKDGHIHSDLVDYVNGTKAAAKEAGVPLIDLHASSLAFFDKLGEAECEKHNPRDSKDATKSDATHLEGTWQKDVAKLVIEELVKIEPGLNGRFDLAKK
ncbi:MAG: rhamnogalacturonan acetylesterase [Tepidisphaeraceae bacterium]